MELKVYADIMSQPSRAILIFCKMNGIIQFEEIKIDLSKEEHKSSEYKGRAKVSEYKAAKPQSIAISWPGAGADVHWAHEGTSSSQIILEINPMAQVPAIVHGSVKLFESHAILMYLACAFPGVAEQWYPADLVKRAKVQSVLDWHHSNLRRGSVTYLLNTVFGPFFGITPNPQAAAEAEKMLSSSLSIIESYWLEEEGKFLLGGLQPSLADLEHELIDEKDRFLVHSRRFMNGLKTQKRQRILILKKFMKPFMVSKQDFKSS